MLQILMVVTVGSSGVVSVIAAVARAAAEGCSESPSCRGVSGGVLAGVVNSPTPSVPTNCDKTVL